MRVYNETKVLVLDVVPPEKMPSPIVPRVEVRTTTAAVAASGAAASAVAAAATVTTQPTNGATADKEVDAALPLSSGLVGKHGKAGKEGMVHTTKGAKDGDSSSGVGAEGGGGGSRGGGGRRKKRCRGLLQHGRRRTRSDHFFEVSATFQVQ